jgi:hypothetical protein
MRCATCHEYGWVGTHKCPPIWWVWDEKDDAGDAIQVRATHAEYAAEKWAEQYDIDAAEGVICGGHREPVVVVRRDGDETRQRFRVSGEFVPRYSANAEPKP